MDTPIINRVAESSLITIDLETYFPAEEIVPFDLKDFLFMGLILKEKDYREALKAHDWELYAHKHVAIFCSADAVVPIWAYMLATVHLQAQARSVFYGRTDEMLMFLYHETLNREIDAELFKGGRVIIKGCSNKPVPVSAYVEISSILKPVVKSLMYGEACSNVPIYKEKKT